MKVRDDKYSRAAGRALLIDGSYLPWQQELIETRLGGSQESYIYYSLSLWPWACEALSR